MKRQKLVELELGRGIAASLVVLFHSSLTVQHFWGIIPLFGIFRGGHSGVEFFFVLSGFIMMLVHAGDIGRPERSLRFLSLRFKRIFPTYWLIFCPMALAWLVKPALFTYAHPNLKGILLDALLLPHSGSMLMPIAWTLRQEWLFYLIFAVMVRWPRTGTILLSTWFFGSLISPISPFPYSNSFVFDIHNVAFGLGIIIYIMQKRVSAVRPKSLSLALGVASYVSLLAGEGIFGFGTSLEHTPGSSIAWTLSYSLAATLIVFGASAPERASRFDHLWLRFGGASYALYLVHPPVESVLIRLASKLAWIPQEVSVPILLVSIYAGALSLALIINVGPERWIAQRLRGDPKRVVADVSRHERSI